MLNHKKKQRPIDQTNDCNFINITRTMIPKDNNFHLLMKIHTMGSHGHFPQDGALNNEKGKQFLVIICFFFSYVF